jgi:hypothetical protein
MREPRKIGDLPTGVNKGILWVLGMLYILVGTSMIVALLSAVGVIEIDPESRNSILSRTLERPTGTDVDCDPDYLAVCLDSDAADYDCEGVPGNGPLFVEGPVIVRGEDRFRLDSDGDGIGCE